MTTKTLAFEIGTEELPAFALHNATIQMKGLMADALKAAGIPFGEVEIYSTPRRLIALISQVPEATEATEQVFRGPAARIGLDEAGNYTKAALGFARGKGVEASDLQLRDENGVSYIYAVKSTPSKPVADLLSDILLSVINGLSWPRSQRWGSHTETFSRPVRWILAMLGDAVVPVEFAGLTSGNLTYGHRFLAPGPFVVHSAEDLIGVLESHFVVTTEAAREASIRSQIAQVEQETGLVCDVKPKTLAEVVNLAEYPTVMVGQFDQGFLAVPKEIIVDSMAVNQRYFALYNQDGSLSNSFLITSNGDPAYAANIIDGNQRVVAARLYDAKFFYDEDLKKPLEAFVPQLAQVVFQEKLGTTLEKTNRIVALADHLAIQAQVSQVEHDEACRAAYLCKADLVTGAVVEFTSVQGIMGSYYAAAAGESPVVAQAINDHYRPRFAGDDLAQSTVGRIVAFADKLDTICGLFAVGQGPTGSSDPFALRRSAIGIIAMLNAGLAVCLEDAIDVALGSYAKSGIEFDVAQVKSQVVDFFVTRTKVMLKDGGNAPDAIDAVLACGVIEPAVITSRVAALCQARATDPEAMADLAAAYARANNLKGDCQVADPNPDLMIDPAEKVLLGAVCDARVQVASALDQGDYPAALARLAALRGPIDAFFDAVMVMDEDPSIRANRLALLGVFVGVFSQVADFGLLAK